MSTSRIFAWLTLLSYVSAASITSHFGPMDGSVGISADSTQPPNYPLAFEDQGATVVHDMVFQVVGELYPHEQTLLVKSDLSYEALEEVPIKTQQIAESLGHLIGNLTLRPQVPPLLEPPTMPTFLLVSKNTTMNIRKAELACREREMRLLAPKDIKTLTEAAAFYLEQFPANLPVDPFWIDTEYDRQSRQLINPISQEPLSIIYKEKLKNKITEGKGSILDDPHWTVAYEPRSGLFDFQTIERLNMQYDEDPRWYVDNDSPEPQAKVLCQSYHLDYVRRHHETLRFEHLRRIQEARAGALLPEREMRDTRLIFANLASDQRKRLKQVEDKYDLIQPLFLDTPDQIRIPTDPKQKVFQNKLNWKRSLGPVGPETQPGILSPMGSKLGVNRTTRHKRSETAEVTEQLWWNIGKAFPVLGPFVGTVHDVMRIKKFNAFRDATGESLRHLYSTVSSQAQEIESIQFAKNEMETQLGAVTAQVSWLYDSTANINLYLELNAVIDRLRTTALAAHAEFLVQVEKLDRWISMMQKGHSPEDLFSGKVLKELRNVLAAKGLNVKPSFQTTESMIIPGKGQTKTVVILSSVRASGPPWTIYSQKALPRYYGNRLFREKLSSEFIAVNNKFSNYVTLSPQRMQECKNELCSLKGPVRSLSHAGCGTIAMLGDPKKLDCPVEELPPEPDGFFEAIEGGIIYSLQRPTVVAISCPFEKEKGIEYRTLEHRGVTFFKPGCRAALSQGDAYWALPGSDHMSGFKEVAKSFVTAEEEFGRLQKSIESKVETAKVATILSQKWPQVFLFGMMGSVLVSLCILCCCHCQLKNRATRMKNWIWSGFSPMESPPERRYSYDWFRRWSECFKRRQRAHEARQTRPSPSEHQRDISPGVAYHSPRNSNGPRNQFGHGNYVHILDSEIPLPEEPQETSTASSGASSFTTEKVLVTAVAAPVQGGRAMKRQGTKNQESDPSSVMRSSEPIFSGEHV